MGKKSIETLVGLFVLLGIAGLVFLALKAANLGTFNSGDTYTLLAKFDNIGGLKVRAPVRSAGVTVGRVASITLDAKTYQGVVRLQVERGVQFPKGVMLERLDECAPLRIVAVEAARTHAEALGQQAHRERLVAAGLKQRQRRR